MISPTKARLCRVQILELLSGRPFIVAQAKLEGKVGPQHELAELKVVAHEPRGNHRHTSQGGDGRGTKEPQAVPPQGHKSEWNRQYNERGIDQSREPYQSSRHRPPRGGERMPQIEHAPKQRCRK